MALTLDTSVMVPVLDNNHEAHERVIASLQDAGEIRLIAHVALEAYRTLTCVRPYRRLPPEAVATAMRSSFPGPLVCLPPDDYLELVTRAPRLGIVGGAIYDALIGVTAQHAGLRLFSRDRRAAAVYSAVGAQCELLS